MRDRLSIKNWSRIGRPFFARFLKARCTLRSKQTVGLNFENLKSEPANCQRVSYLFCPNQNPSFFWKLRLSKICLSRFSESPLYLLSAAAHFKIFGSVWKETQFVASLLHIVLDDAAVDVLCLQRSFTNFKCRTLLLKLWHSRVTVVVDLSLRSQNKKINCLVNLCLGGHKFE